MANQYGAQHLVVALCLMMGGCLFDTGHNELPPQEPIDRTSSAPKDARTDAACCESWSSGGNKCLLTGLHATSDIRSVEHFAREGPVKTASQVNLLSCAHSVVVAIKGTVYRIDPEQGSILKHHAIDAGDVFATASHPGVVVMSAAAGERQTMVSTYELVNEQFVVRDREGIEVEGAYVVYGSDPLVGLAIGEETSLFSLGTWTRAFAVGSFSAREQDGVFHGAWLLEQEPHEPTLAYYQWFGSFRRTETYETGEDLWSTQPRLVRDAPVPLLVGGHGAGVTIRRRDGEMVGTWEPERAAGDTRAIDVADAVMLGARGPAAALVGSAAQVVLFAQDQSHGLDRVELGGTVGYDPSPQRLMAYDVYRNRLWVAVGPMVYWVDQAGGHRFAAGALSLEGNVRSITLMW